MNNSKRQFQQWLPGQILIAPSLLAADYSQLNNEVRAVAEAGAELLHLDIMDGHFVPNISFGADVVGAIRGSSEQLFDVHLMISDPAKYAERFAKAGADHITFHVEIEDDIQSVIDRIHDLGCSAGLSLRPGTSYETIEPYIDSLEMILVMTVEPGFGGQSFMADQLPKIAAFRELIDRSGRSVRLEVDGGIAAESAKRVIAAGADTLVAGSSVFKHKGDYRSAIDALRK